MSTAPALALVDPTQVDDMDAADVLVAVRESRRREWAEAAHQLLLACAWADQHHALEPGDEAVFHARGADGGVTEPISGAGCPPVAEYAIAEFGAVLGESTTAAKRLIGHALELRHRLPRLWALVQAGRVAPWRARAVAERTIHAPVPLTDEAAAWIDTQAAAVVGKVSGAQVDRLIDAAILKFALVAEPDLDVCDTRRVDLHDGDPRRGTLFLEAEVSVADGLDLDHALTHRQRAPCLGLHRHLGRTPLPSPRRPRPHPNRPQPPHRLGG